MHMKRFFTECGPKAVGPYCTATIAGDIIFCSGMLGLDPAAGKLSPGGIEAETAQALVNLQLISTELEVTMADAAKVVVYLTNMSDFAAVNNLYKQAFGPDYPARTCIAVASLPLGASVEIDVTFYKSSKEASFDL